MSVVVRWTENRIFKKSATPFYQRFFSVQIFYPNWYFVTSWPNRKASKFGPKIYKIPHVIYFDSRCALFARCWVYFSMGKTRTRAQRESEYKTLLYLYETTEKSKIRYTTVKWVFVAKKFLSDRLATLEVKRVFIFSGFDDRLIVSGCAKIIGL